MNTRHFYGGLRYEFATNPADPSGAGCIREIVENDEYRLSMFRGLSGVIIDIGANCGVASTILAKQNPGAHIYAFEPHPPTFRLLLQNLWLNGLTNVIPMGLAVGGNLRWRASLCLHPEFSGGHTACSRPQDFERYQQKTVTAIDVPCVPFDAFIESHAIGRVELLKIDCEGSEFEILLQSQHVKNGLVQNIVGEFHDLAYNTQVATTSEELLAYVNSCVAGLKLLSVLRL